MLTKMLDLTDTSTHCEFSEVAAIAKSETKNCNFAVWRVGVHAILFAALDRAPCHA